MEKGKTMESYLEEIEIRSRNAMKNDIVIMISEMTKGRHELLSRVENPITARDKERFHVEYALLKHILKEIEKEFGG
jgi:DNA-binding ferritin-like protein